MAMAMAMGLLMGRGDVTGQTCAFFNAVLPLLLRAERPSGGDAVGEAGPVAVGAMMVC